MFLSIMELAKVVSVLIELVTKSSSIRIVNLISMLV